MNVSTSTYFEITAIDEYNSTAISSFSATVNGTTYYTSNGTITTTLEINASETHDVFIFNASGYFNRTYTAYNIGSNLQAELHQAEPCFNASEYITNSSIDADNFTIESTTFTSCINISAGTYNVTAKKSGWFDKVLEFTVGELGTDTFTVENMTYANLTIFAVDGDTNESLSGYNLTIESLNFTGWPGESANLVTNHSFYLINGTYNATIDLENYAIEIANITVDGHTNYTFTLYKQNSILITIRDEITNDIITDNITVRFTSNATTWENVTNTGSLFVHNITPNEYELLFYSANYSTRTYTVTVGERSTQTLTAYMIASAYSTVFTIKDIDTYSLLADVGITMYKQIGSVWSAVESKESDISGKAQFYYDPVANYRFYLVKSGYEDYVFNLNPILFSTYDVFMTKGDVLNYSVDYDEISIIYSPQIFANDENTSFNFMISSPNGYLVQYGFNLTYPGGNTSNSGTNAIGEQLSASVNITGATAYDFVVLVYYYETSDSGLRTFTHNLPITLVNATATSWLANKNNTYGLGIFERVLIATIIIVFTVGISTLVGQLIPGFIMGMFLYGFLVFIGFIPIWVILPSMFIGVLFIVWKSGGL